MEAFSDRLKKLREEHNLSQRQLATLINVSHQYITLWENGNNLPRADKLIDLSNTLNVSIDYLLKGSDNPSSTESTIDSVLSLKSISRLKKADRETIAFLNSLFESERGINSIKYLTQAYEVYTNLAHINHDTYREIINSSNMHKAIRYLQDNKNITDYDILYYILIDNFSNAFKIWLIYKKEELGIDDESLID